MALLSGVPRTSEASLIGDPATCAVTHALNVVTCVPASATVGSGSEFIFPSIVGDLFSVDVAASSITLAFLPFDFGIGFRPDLVFLATFGDLGSSLGALVGVSMATFGLVENLDASHLSFTADSVTISFAGSRWSTPETPPPSR